MAHRRLMPLILAVVSLAACTSEPTTPSSTVKKKEGGGARQQEAVDAKQTTGSTTLGRVAEARNIGSADRGIACDASTNKVGYCDDEGNAVQFCSEGSWYDIACAPGTLCGFDEAANVVDCYPQSELTK